MARDTEQHRGDRVRGGFASASRRYQGSWVQEVAARLKAVDVVNAITLLGATLLLSALPFVILLSSLANQRIDDDLSRHLGLDSRGAHIVRGLFRASPAHPAVPIATGLIIALAGTVAVVACIRDLYEGVFELDHHGWRDFPRFLVWTAILLAFLLAEGTASKPLRSAGGPALEAVTGFVILTGFFWWTMHFLLSGRVSWRVLIRPALVTSLLWLGLAVFSSFYFSSAVTSDSRLYGTIGVVFSLLTWFIAIGAVIVLGAVCGAVWHERSGRRPEP